MDQTAEPARQTARRPPATPPGSEPSVLTLQPGLMICHTTARDLAAVDAIREFPGDSEFLHMNCQLDGHIEGRIGSHPLAYARGDISLGFAAGESFQVRHCARFQNLEVMVTPVVLSELIGEEGGFILGGDAKPGFFLCDAGRCRRTWRTASILVGLMRSAPLQRLLVHAATLECLHWHLTAFERGKRPGSLSPYECRQLDEARARLLQDLAAPPTIAELARAVGLSQFKLKEGFKRRFDCSIYALFQRTRMDEARRLLKSWNVTETAVQLGYTNVSHFSAAFRKQFGHPPSGMRREVRSE